MSSNLGQVVEASELKDWFTDSEGSFIELNDGKHSAAALVVWRMEGEEASPKREAFARLLAAAPDMLEALKWVAVYLDPECGVVLEAISKATGEAK